MIFFVIFLILPKRSDPTSKISNTSKGYFNSFLHLLIVATLSNANVHNAGLAKPQRIIIINLLVKKKL